MSAIRVTESSGSNGALQIADGSGGFTSSNKLFFNTQTGQILLLSGSGSPNSLDESNYGDVAFFVSGAIGSKGQNTKGAAVFGGDVVISGTLHGGSGLSGSLTQLSDGSSYLVAGDNISINSASNGQITIVASTTGGSTIGNAGDGSYADGLFTDFTTNTTIGTAIDRFNEVLKALAPAPAPDLDDINSLNTGISPVTMSFGSSNNQSSATPAYISVGSSAGLAAAVNVNSVYKVTTGSNNIRLGTFNGSTHISGTLNADASSNSQGNSIQNYPNFSFGDADSGTLYLDINGTGSFSIDLTSALIGSGTSGLGTGSYVDHNGSGFNFFSTPTTGTFSNGNAFDSFKHRTGQFVIAHPSQRNGWNYARLRHVIGGTTKTTNYIEWVNDSNNDALAVAGNSLTFEGGGSIYLSGIEYFRNGTAQYKSRVTNVYKYVYDNTPIQFPTSTGGSNNSNASYTISSQDKPTISTGDGENHTKVLHLTASSNVTSNYMLGGSLTAGVTVTHPLKSNLTNQGQSTVSNILMYNLSNNSDEQTETFRAENFRIISGSYNTQASLIGASNIWTGSVHMTASNGGHSDGLQFYKDRLYSPLNTINNGNFSSISNGPSDNPNYSGQSGQRTFYRWFKNETGSTKYDFTIAINGSQTTIVPAATALNSGRIRVFVKFPSDGTRETGWLDLATEFVLDSYSDNHGAHTANGSLSFDNSLNATNYVTLGTVGVGDDEYIGLRIEADAGWSGYIESITVSFGAGTGTIAAIPNLDDIDCNDDGTDCNLSFGSSKAISGYANVGTAAGFAATDINGLYETDSDSNNLRRSVFALDTTIEGDLNEDVSSNSNGSHVNHVANSFSDANSGSLKLEVNGSVLHEVEITGSYNLVGSGVPGSGTATAFNSNGSGFWGLSTWEAAEYNNGVPYYLEAYRTGKYRVVVADQRNGWNYARVVHSVGGADRTTNYVEWVNDNDNNALSSTGVGLTSFGDNSFSYASGVKYFNSPSGSILARISNIYRNVYSDSNSSISFASLTNAAGTKIVQSGPGLSSTKSTSSSTDSLQTLNSNANSQNEALHVSGTIDFSRSKSLPGTFTTAYSCAGALQFDHPLKTNHTTSTQTATNLLVWTPSNTSNVNTNEYFTDETHRIINNQYNSQDDVTGAGQVWNSQRSINDNGNYAAYATGLLVYDTYIMSPLKGGNSGDFRNNDDGGNIESPAGNPNYSSLTNATRDYFRGFLNNTSNDLARITIVLYGDATIVGKSSALGTNKNIWVELKVPGKTGWLDLGTPSAGSGNLSDGDGCLFGDPDATVDNNGATNVCTFNGSTVDGTASGAEYFVIRISAHKNWTGYVDRIAVTWSG